jgi:DNA invertase Pin-like site-specific DNA recombinase
MRSTNWSAHTSFAEVKARAGGRRHYNFMRQQAAARRRARVARLLFRKGWYGLRGSTRLIARRLHVSVATVRRDIRQIMAEGYRCHACGCIVSSKTSETA